MSGPGKKQTGKKPGGDVASKRRGTLAIRVKKKANRSESSRQWLQRQLNDP